jgi:hypothetical protein
VCGVCLLPELCVVLISAANSDAPVISRTNNHNPHFNFYKAWKTIHIHLLNHLYCLTGNTDNRWRRRYCALKGSQLFVLRTAASQKPLAALNLSGAQISASKTPLYPADDDGHAGNDDDDVLWVLRVVLTDGAGSRTAGGRRSSGSGRNTKLKLAAPSQELQVCCIG